MTIEGMTPLAPVLAEKEKELLSNLPAELATGIQKTNADFAATYKPSPIAKGSVAPNFELSNATGTKVSLADLLRDNSAVVVTWYRGLWCPYCNVALRALTQANDEIERLGAKLVCISAETPDESLSTTEKLELKFEVLSDDGLLVADKYGIVFTVSEEVKGIYKGIGVDLDGMNGNEGKRKAKLPLPATFVLDKHGKVVYSFVDVDYTKRAEPADIIAAVKSVV